MIRNVFVVLLLALSSVSIAAPAKQDGLKPVVAYEMAFADYKAALVEVDSSEVKVIDLSKASQTFESIFKAIADGSEFKLTQNISVRGRNKFEAGVADTHNTGYIQTTQYVGSKMSGTTTSAPVASGIWLSITPTFKSTSIVDTAIDFRQALDLGNSMVSHRKMNAEHEMQVGDFQILGWQNNGKAYYLVVQLKAIDNT